MHCDVTCEAKKAPRNGTHLAEEAKNVPMFFYLRQCRAGHGMLREVLLPLFFLLLLLAVVAAGLQAD